MMKTRANAWAKLLLGALILNSGLLNRTDTALAADIVCRGTMFGDTDFAAYHGENGFGRIELFYARGGSVEVPLKYLATNRQGEAIFRGNNPDQPSDVIEIFARTPVNSGSRIVATYNGNVFVGNCSSNISSRPPTNSTPTAGSFSGRGEVSGSVFGQGRSADASLDFNQDRFSLGLAIPPGTGAQVMYQGTINQLRSTQPDNPNSFILVGEVQSFASSRNNLTVIETQGRCTIEVVDSRVTATTCRTSLRNSNTQFAGIAQF